MKILSLFTTELKAKVSRGAPLGWTIPELMMKHRPHPNRVTQWERQANNVRPRRATTILLMRRWAERLR